MANYSSHTICRCFPLPETVTMVAKGKWVMVRCISALYLSVAQNYSRVSHLGNLFNLYAAVGAPKTPEVCLLQSSGVRLNYIVLYDINEALGALWNGGVRGTSPSSPHCLVTLGNASLLIPIFGQNMGILVRKARRQDSTDDRREPVPVGWGVGWGQKFGVGMLTIFRYWGALMRGLVLLYKSLIFSFLMPSKSPLSTAYGLTSPLPILFRKLHKKDHTWTVMNQI